MRFGAICSPWFWPDIAGARVTGRLLRTAGIAAMPPRNPRDLHHEQNKEFLRAQTAQLMIILQQVLQTYNNALVAFNGVAAAEARADFAVGGRGRGGPGGRGRGGRGRRARGAGRVGFC